METEGPPGLLLGLWQWCKKIREVISPSQSDCPRPTLHTPRGAPISSSSSRLVRLDVPSLSSQADTEDKSLVFCVLYSWLSFVCGNVIDSIQLLFSFFGFCLARNLFETMIPCRSHPHMSVQCFIIAGGSYCSVSTSEPWHIKQTKWIKKSSGKKKTAHFLSTAQSCPHVVGESGGGGCSERCCYWWSKNMHVWV